MWTLSFQADTLLFIKRMVGIACFADETFSSVKSSFNAPFWEFIRNRQAAKHVADKAKEDGLEDFSRHETLQELPALFFKEPPGHDLVLFSGSLIPVLDRTHHLKYVDEYIESGCQHADGKQYLSGVFGRLDVNELLKSILDEYDGNLTNEVIEKRSGNEEDYVPSDLTRFSFLTGEKEEEVFDARVEQEHQAQTK